MSGVFLLLKSGVPSGVPDSITILDYNLFALVTAPGSVSCRYRLTAAGVAEADQGLGYEVLEDWINNEANASLYECRVTINAGALTSGTSGSWLSLSSTREWLVTQSGIGVADCNMTVEIRLASSGVVQDSATILLSATVEAP